MITRYLEKLGAALHRIAMVLTLAISCAGPAAHAVTPAEMLKDPVMEARARAISQQLRCVVCQNQSIDDSNAPLAQDLRILVRDRLTAGDTDTAAMNYIVARYGNFVLLKPPVQSNTLLLWFGPILFLLIAGFAFLRFVRGHDTAPSPDQAADLTAEERRRVDALMNEGNAS